MKKKKIKRKKKKKKQRNQKRIGKIKVGGKNREQWFEF